MEQKFYCPNCFGELEKLTGCGTVGYFCNSCKILISRSKMLTHEEMEKCSLKKSEQNIQE